MSFASKILKTVLAIVMNILIFTILFTAVPVLNIDFGIVINLVLALLIMYVSRVYFSISPFKYKQAYIHTRLDKSNNVLHINASRKFGKKLFEINNTVCNDYFVRNYFQCVTGNSFQDKCMFDKYSLYEIVPNEISDYNEGSAIFDAGKVPYKGEIYYDVSLLNKYGILYDEDGIDNKYFKVSAKNKGHIKYIYDYYGDIQLKNLYPVELLVDSTDLGDVFIIEESTKYLVFKNRLDDGNEWVKSYYTLNNDDADVNYEAMKKVWTKKYFPTELFNSMFLNFTCCILMLVFVLLYVNNSISGTESFTIAEKMLSNIIDTTGFIPKVIILCISAIIGEVIVTYIKPTLFYKMSLEVWEEQFAIRRNRAFKYSSIFVFAGSSFLIYKGRGIKEKFRILKTIEKYHNINEE